MCSGIMLAMGVVTTEAALTVTVLVYGMGFLALCAIVSGIRRGCAPAAAIAVAMVPMAIYGVQDMLGFWPGSEAALHRYRDLVPSIGSHRLFMELGTIVAAALTLWFYLFPFIPFVAAVALWFLSLELAGWLAPDRAVDLDLRRDVLLWFGLAGASRLWRSTICGDLAPISHSDCISPEQWPSGAG
jgi:hypothetical protein